MSYMPVRVLANFTLDDNAYGKFFSKPHMVGLLAIICSVIGYYAFNLTESKSEDSFVHNSQK